MAIRERDREEPITNILEGAQERVGEPIDYLSLILSKFALALSYRAGSTERQLELNDLEDLLYPFIDEKFTKANKKLEAERQTWNTNESGEWNAAYHRGRVKILTALMKRNDMLTLGTI